MAVELSEAKKTLLTTEGHILALGGPGSGKTYIALLKAEKELAGKTLKGGQHILFLSFARATIARVAQQAKILVSSVGRNSLEMSTYHGFTWNLLRSHGYLLRAGAPIRLLPPPEAAARFAEIKSEARPAEQERLFNEEGLLHFDLFARKASELLSKSKSLAKIICDTYPTIILDEFQDTNADEWALIKTLGANSRLIALADAEQRIYEFRGADPKRIGEFVDAFSPTPFDFGAENNRSSGTDITQFGNDLLSGANKGKTYKDVVIVPYPIRKGAGLHMKLKVEVLTGRKRLLESGKSGWSLAVLVPSKSLMLDVSDFLNDQQVMTNGRKAPAIPHEVALETNGPSLAAVGIAGILEDYVTVAERTHRLIQDVCAHMRGRKGNEMPSKGELVLSGALSVYVTSGKIRGKNREAIVEECLGVAKARHEMKLSGNPVHDWLAVRELLGASSAEPVARLADDAKYLRLMHKGALLQSKLSELWRDQRSYGGASQLVKEALLQEHFSASTRDWRGIHVMTIHKSKGKEFDEVIIYEGSFYGKIVARDADDKRIAQARLMLRVGVTRAMTRTTIVTPQGDACRFL